MIWGYLYFRKPPFTKKSASKAQQRSGDVNISPARAFPPAQCHPRPRRKCVARRDTWRRSTQRGCPKSCCWFPVLCRRECPPQTPSITAICSPVSSIISYDDVLSHILLCLWLHVHRSTPEPRLATGLWFVPFCILVAGASFGAAYVVIQSSLSGSARFSLIHPLYGPNFCWNYSSSALISGWPLFPSTCNKYVFNTFNNVW